MNAKRIFLIVLVVVFVTSFVSAGGGRDSSSGGTQAVTADGIPVQTSPIKYFIRSGGASDTLPDNPKMHAYIEEKTGIKLQVEAIINEAFRERVDLMVAANDEIDGAQIYGLDFLTALQDRGVIIQLNDLLDKHGPNVKRVMSDGIITTKDGSIWALPRAEEFPQGYGPNIRGDWLAALGMPIPTSMAEIDAYLAAVKERDLAGNGQTVPFLPNTLVYGMSNFFPYYLKVNGNYMTSTGFGNLNRYMDDNGIIRPIIGHPDLINVIAKFREWYALGYMPQDISVLGYGEITGIRSAATFGMQAGWYSDGVNNLFDWNEANPGKPKAWLEPIPPLKNPPSGRSMWPSNDRYSLHVPFFKAGKNSVHLMRYFDWICSSPDNVLTVAFGIEGDHWYWIDNKTAAVRTLSGEQRYSGFYTLAGAYWPGLMPRLSTTPDNPRQLERFRFMDTIRSWNASNYPFDNHVPYSYRNTDAEFVTADGSTLIRETIVRMITGQMPLSEWDRVLAQYNAIEGDIYSKVWTDQYYDYIGRPRPRN